VKIIIAAAVLLAAQALVADDNAELKYARRYGAGTKIILRCVDQDGGIVTNAAVSTALYPDGSFEHAIIRNVRTDANGVFVMEGKTNGEFSYSLSKTGYYDTREQKFLYEFNCNKVSGGLWQPYGATNTVVLKRKLNPVAMAVATYSCKDHDIPAVGKKLGFDLFVNDWVAPEGKGVHADLFVVFEWDGSKYQDYNGSALTLLFCDPCSGVIRTASDVFSTFKSPYFADTNGVYAREIKFSYKRGRSASDSVDMNLKAEECLILRVRTRLDEKGNLISAHYAKIYAPLGFGYALETPGAMGLLYYLNPAANDPNLEADTTKNLLNPRDLGFVP
jgi:hypothetical protein